MLKKNQFATCIPLVAPHKEALYKEIEAAVAQKPDYLEWRRDYFLENNPESEKEILCKLKALEQGLIYTFRWVEEGGHCQVSEKDRCQCIINAIQSGGVNYIDLELDGDVDTLVEVKKNLKKTETKLILSHHHFEKTYDYNEILGIFEMMEEVGADVLKIALTAETDKDFRNLLAAGNTYNIRTHKSMILISMGNAGRLSRILPEFMGGSLTFAAGEKNTAPGQLKLSEILEKRKALGI